MIRETRGFPSPFTPFKEVPPGNAKAAENPMLKDKARIVRELEKIIGPNGVICEEWSSSPARRSRWPKW